MKLEVNKGLFLSFLWWSVLAVVLQTPRGCLCRCVYGLLIVTVAEFSGEFSSFELTVAGFSWLCYYFFVSALSLALHLQVNDNNLSTFFESLFSFFIRSVWCSFLKSLKFRVFRAPGTFLCFAWIEMLSAVLDSLNHPRRNNYKSMSRGCI